MKYQLFDRVVLKVHLPDMRLKANDIVTVVEFLAARRDLPNAYCVEAFNAIGADATIVNEPLKDPLDKLIFEQGLHIKKLFSVPNWI